MKTNYKAGAYYAAWQKRWVPTVRNGADVLYFGTGETTKRKAVRKARRVLREIRRRERRFGKRIIIEE